MSSTLEYYQQWYDSLNDEKKKEADIIVSKVNKMDPNALASDALAIACAELDENQPALAEYRFVQYLKKELDNYDTDPEARLQSLAKNGYPIIKDIVKKISAAGISAHELMTLLKVFDYEGIQSTFYRFEHLYMDDLDDSEYPSFVISEVGTDGELTGRTVNVYGWLSYLNPES